MLTYPLNRNVVLRAPRELVFAWWTDSERFSRWWGKDSYTADEVGGEICIRHRGGAIARGKITEIQAAQRISFTYGYENSHLELPPESSTVDIELHSDAQGTCLELRHTLPTKSMREVHVGGWRYHLGTLANAVADEHHKDASVIIDTWFEAWAETDDERRRNLLADCVIESVSLHDAFASLAGIDDLSSHMRSTHNHLPGVRLRRTSEPRHCQGMVLVDWQAEGPEGPMAMQGTNVMSFALDGKIRSITGLH
ncbi:MAG: SRPBCC domain-containing protein [Planctomycetota bacterium]